MANSRLTIQINGSKSESLHGITRHFTLTQWQSFAESMANKDLIMFSLNSYNLGDDGLSVIAPMLASMNRLECLDLSKCHLSTRSTNVIRSLLDKFSQLHTLSLSANNLTDDIIPVLEFYLPQLKFLRRLYLKDIGMTVDGLRHIINKLIPTLNLEVLDINGHGFTRDVLIDLTNTLRKAHSLRKVSIHSPYFTDIQLKFLANPKKCKMQRYSFGGPLTIIDVSTAKNIKAIMWSNPYILKMRGGIIHQSDEARRIDEIAHVINANRQALMRQRCVDYLVLVACLFHSRELSSKVPHELKLMILEWVLPKFMDIRLRATWDLLLRNFGTRRSIINDGYADMSSWWNQGSLFKTRSEQVLWTLDPIATKVVKKELSGVSATKWISRISPF